MKFKRHIFIFINSIVYLMMYYIASRYIIDEDFKFLFSYSAGASGLYLSYYLAAKILK